MFLVSGKNFRETNQRELKTSVSIEKTNKEIFIYILNKWYFGAACNDKGTD